MTKIRVAFRAGSLGLLLLVVTATAAAPTSATSQTRVLGGGQVFLATAQWAEPDGHGNTLYTFVRVLDGLVFDEFGEAHFGQGTSIDLYRDSVDASGNSIFTENDFSAARLPLCRCSRPTSG